jgi:hypothetical protein
MYQFTHTDTGVDFNSNLWLADAQINRRDTKFRNLGIRLCNRILTLRPMKIYKTVWLTGDEF